jgi:hypothetical protein
MLRMFSVECEQFRPAPPYDFRALPNAGRLYYETRNWGMTGGRWLELAAAALDEFDADAILTRQRSAALT